MQKVSRLKVILTEKKLTNLWLARQLEVNQRGHRSILTMIRRIGYPIGIILDNWQALASDDLSNQHLVGLHRIHHKKKFRNLFGGFSDYYVILQPHFENHIKFSNAAK